MDPKSIETAPSQPATWGWLGALILLTILLYSPGLGGPFLFDDFPNIVDNEALQISEISAAQLAGAIRSYSGPNYDRALSMLSFALNFRATGMDPFYFKLVNLLLHLANGIGLFLLLRLWLQASRRGVDGPRPRVGNDWIALFVVGAWLLHPIHLTSVLYVVQRMTLLAGSFTILGMLAYTQGRILLATRPRAGWGMILAAYLACTPLAFLAKESGVLLPLFLLLIEWLLFRFSGPRRTLALLHLLFLGLPLVAGMTLLLARPELSLAAYSYRPFTMEQRLLTEPRVLFLYLRLLLFPLRADFSLFHDDIPLSTSLLEPLTTALAAAGILAITATGLLLHRRLPLVALGLLLFLGAHSLESTILPLEIAHEHRNYLASIGPLLLVALGAAWIATHTERRAVRPLLPIAFVMLCGGTTWLRATDWSDLPSLVSAQAYHHPGSSRSQYQLGYAHAILMDEDPERAPEHAERARTLFLLAAELDPGQRSGSLIAHAFVDAKSRHTLDPEFEARLLGELRTAPVSALTANGMISLLRCVAQGHCVLPYPTLRRMVDNAASAPTITAADQGKIFAAFLNIIMAQGDLDTALFYGSAAVQIMPRDPQHRINLGMILALSGSFAEAEEQVRIVRAADGLGINAGKLSRLEQLITRLRNGTPPE